MFMLTELLKVPSEEKGKPATVIRRNYDPTNKAEVFAVLRREIMAARLKVTLDRELKRETSETVKRLAGMKLPPIVD